MIYKYIARCSTKTYFVEYCIVVEYFENQEVFTIGCCRFRSLNHEQRILLPSRDLVFLFYKTGWCTSTITENNVFYIYSPLLGSNTHFHSTWRWKYQRWSGNKRIWDPNLISMHWMMPESFIIFNQTWWYTLTL